jgi:hypothetical protein
MVGWQAQLPAAKLSARYGDHAGYVKKVDASAQALVQAGWLLPQDAERLKADARTAKVP